MYKISFILFIFSTFFLANANETDYQIGVNDAYANLVGKRQVDELFTRMYAPLGIIPKIQFMPSRRGLKMANQGVFDAESGRVLQVAKAYPNLMVVPEPMIRHQLSYFCLNVENCSLQRSLRYALIGGFEAGKAFCAKSEINCLFDQSQSFLSTALSNGAIDVLIGSRAITLGLLCNGNAKKVYYRDIDGFEVVSYHLIHKRHAKLVDGLTDSIKTMHKEHYFEDFVAQTSAMPTSCKLVLHKLNA